MNYKVGDTIICRIYEDKVVRPYEKYDREEVLEVIYVGSDDHYLLYVPNDVWIHDAFVITSRNIKHYSLEDKFIDDTAYLIQASYIARSHSKSQGVCCARCKEHFPYAENTSGGEFRCYQCKRDRWR